MVDRLNHDPKTPHEWAEFLRYYACSAARDSFDDERGLKIIKLIQAQARNQALDDAEELEISADEEAHNEVFQMGLDTAITRYRREIRKLKSVP